MLDLLTSTRLTSTRLTSTRRASTPRSPRALLLLGLAALSYGCGDDVEAGPSAGGAGSGGSSQGGRGGGTAAWSPPALRDPVSLSDDELSRQALGVLDGSAAGTDGCRNCHTLGRPTLTRWSSLTNQFGNDCLVDTSLTGPAAVDEMLACFRRHAAPATSLSPDTFGIYAAAAHLPWFTFVFEHSTENQADGQAAHDEFVASVGMPRAGTLLTQAQFDLVAEWFARGLPKLFELVPEENGVDCSAGLAPRLGSHIEQMALLGWRARNEQVPLLMFGCGEGQSGADCLGNVPLARDAPYDEAWDATGDAQIRILYDNSATPSRFWSRSSADGRIIASGRRDGGSSDFTGQFLDLEQDRVIDADFSYDPTFFPDNSGFMVQRDGGYSSAAPGGGPTSGGADRGDVAVICEQSVLSGNPTEITGDEAQCVAIDSEIGLYQQLAKSLDGEDYWVVFGAYDSDNGGLAPVLDNPSAAFGNDSVTTLRPMINQGTRFAPGVATRIPMPLQGDPMLSPSGRLLVTRLKGREYTTEFNGVDVVSAEQSGYALYLVTTTRNGDELTATLDDVGRICMQGGKATLSYDERWMVFHHYVTADDAAELGFSGADDPEFQAYLEQGASNLYLVDLLDGSARLITNMNPGQYALFPHFRSDGWLYFVVRTLDGAEYFAASDAALLLEGSSSN
jgi:hypothetical protein